jgi:hypothetical protein
VGCDYEQLAAIVFSPGMRRDVRGESAENRRNNLGMVVDFQRDDSSVSRRRICDDVREIAVQREQYCAQLLRPGNDSWVRRFRVDVVAQAQDLVTVRAQLVNDGV